MLYHYTDFGALNGILKNKEIWLHNLLNMNDLAEMSYFFTSLRKYVCNTLTDLGLEEKAGTVDKVFATEMRTEYQHSAYAACFTRYRDDAAQWERYGDGGRGVCIAFREDLLRKMAHGAVSVQEVYYDTDISGHPLASKVIDAAKNSEEFSVEDPFVKELMSDIWMQSVAYKHPAFACENEVRLVFYPFMSDEFKIPPQYYVSPTHIKKYYPINLNFMCERNNIDMNDLITEIIIGPTSNQSIDIIKDYLENVGLFHLVDYVKKSECPLRKPVR